MRRKGRKERDRFGVYGRTGIFFAGVELYHQNGAYEGPADAEAEKDFVEVDEAGNGGAGIDAREQTGA